MGLFKPPAPELDEGELNEFLNHVALGAQDKAEGDAEENPSVSIR